MEQGALVLTVLKIPKKEFLSETKRSLHKVAPSYYFCLSFPFREMTTGTILNKTHTAMLSLHACSLISLLLATDVSFRLGNDHENESIQNSERYRLLTVSLSACQ